MKPVAKQIEEEDEYEEEDDDDIPAVIIRISYS
jgi:hypothetical protein